MKGTILVAAIVALLIVDTFCLPKPKPVNEAKEGKEIKSETTDTNEKTKKTLINISKIKGETEKKNTTENGTDKNDEANNTNVEETQVKKSKDTNKNDAKESNETKSAVTIDVKEAKKTTKKQTNDEKTDANKVDGKQDNIKSDKVLDEYIEYVSEEEIYMDDEDIEDKLGAEAVKGKKRNLIEDIEEDMYLPISGRLKGMMLPESERVMDEPDFLPRAEAVMEEADDTSDKHKVEEGDSGVPAAERVMEQESGTKPGGDGKMKMNLNLKDLDGNPSDLTVGAAAVGLMSQAVKSKGPDDSQVNAVAGFGHQIMGLVSELEKDIN